MLIILGTQSSLWTWLGPVLTFCGSVLLFIASMITLWRTNKAADRRSGQERQNERDRDFRLWQRDTLLPIGYEIVQAANEVPREYNKLRRSKWPAEPESFEVVYEWGRKVGEHVVRLYLLGARETAASCAELRDAINNPQLRDVILELDHLERTVISQQLHNKVAESETRKQELQGQFESLMQAVHEARVAFGEIFARELARTNQPESCPTAMPPKIT